MASIHLSLGLMIAVILALIICLWMTKGLRTVTVGPSRRTIDSDSQRGGPLIPSVAGAALKDAISGKALPPQVDASGRPIAPGLATPMTTGDPILDGQSDSQAEIDNHSHIDVADEQAAGGFNIERNDKWFEGNDVIGSFLGLLSGGSKAKVAAFMSTLATPIKHFGSPRKRHYYGHRLMSDNWGPLAILDGVVGQAGVTKVQLATQLSKKGDLVDLYAIVGVPDLAAGAPSSIDQCSIGRRVFVREATGWRYRGLLENLSQTTAGSGTRWDLYPAREIGWGAKATLDSCPFPANICGALWTWAANGQTGRLTFGDGTTYVFDGRFVTQQ